MDNRDKRMNKQSSTLKKPPLVIIAGPTAVGKSDLAVQLAKKIGGEIISADSMQIYKGMDIGTAKITKEEMQGVRHYMIDELSPTEPFNVVGFQQMAKECCGRVLADGKIPILTGGTGFYIQSLLYDIDFQEEDEDDSIRKELEKLGEEIGKEALHAQLAVIDPEAAKAIPSGNIRRVIRALEYNRKTGAKISDHNEEQRKRESVWNDAFFVLTDERESMFERINLRVDKMKEAGLVNEVMQLKAMGCCRGMSSMQGIGYHEILSALEGEISLEQAYEDIKKHTRHFAKRQLTWFKREKSVIWIDRSVLVSEEEKLQVMMEHLYKKGIIDDKECTTT